MQPTFFWPDTDLAKWCVVAAKGRHVKGEWKPAAPNTPPIFGTGHEDYERTVADKVAAGYEVWTCRSLFHKEATKRTAEGVIGASCISIDIDVHPSGYQKGDPQRAALYASQSEAVEGLRAAVAGGVIPSPTAVVSSGGGLHVWWRLKNFVRTSHWQDLTTRFVAHVRAFDAKLAADTSVWARPEGLLRPWPSLNLKQDGNPRKVVLLLGREDRVHPVETFETLLADVSAAPAKAKAKDKAKDKTAPGKRMDSGDDGMPDSRLPIDMLIDKCGLMQHYREIQHKASEPAWVAALSVAKFSTYPEAAAEMLSEGYTDYVPGDGTTKMSHITEHAPWSCEKLRERICNGSREHCQGCPLLAQSLGNTSANPVVRVLKAKHIEPPKIMPPPTAVAAPTENDTLHEQVQEALASATNRPAYIGDEDENDASIKAYVVDDDAGGTMYGYDANGVPIPMTRGVWWIDGFSPEHEVAYLVTMIRGQIRRWPINSPGRILSSPTSLRSVLSSVMIAPIDGSSKCNDALMRYAAASMAACRLDDAAAAFGWTADESFVLGALRIGADGSLRRSVTAGNAYFMAERAEHEKRMGFAGTYAGALANMERATRYAKPAALLMIGVAMAAPLVAMGERNGAFTHIVAPHNSGKTATLTLLKSVFGMPLVSTLDGTVSEAEIGNQFSTLHHLPALFEELGVMGDGEKLANMIFMSSEGTQRGRASRAGASRQSGSWRTTFVAVSNSPIAASIRRHRRSVDAVIAQQNRLLEIVCPEERMYNDPEDGRTPVSEALLARHRGMLGVAWVRYIMEHKVRLLERMHELRSKYAAVADGSERFIMTTVAGAQVALEAMRDLGWNVASDDTVSKAIFLALQSTEEQHKDVSYNNQITEIAAVAEANLYPAFIRFSRASDGKLVALNRDHIDRSQVLGRVELHDDGTAHYRVSADALAREIIALRKGTRANRLVLSRSEVTRVLEELRRAGVIADQPTSAVRLGTGGGSAHASARPVKCVYYTRHESPYEEPGMAGKPAMRLATVDGKPA
jgi:hypothetical protein